MALCPVGPRTEDSHHLKAKGSNTVPSRSQGRPSHLSLRELPMSFDYKTKAGSTAASRAKERLAGLLAIVAPNLRPELADLLVDELVTAAVSEASYQASSMMNRHNSLNHPDAPLP